MQPLVLLVIGFHARHDVPLWLARHLRASTAVAQQRPETFRWEPVSDINLVPRIGDRYFGADMRKVPCDLFLIQGVPAACIVYEKTTKNGAPIVTECHVNKGLVMLFDAGMVMRRQLYKRYKHIEFKNATNRDAFLRV